jgi:hypothetical protein
MNTVMETAARYLSGLVPDESSLDAAQSMGTRGLEAAKSAAFGIVSAVQAVDVQAEVDAVYARWLHFPWSHVDLTVGSRHPSYPLEELTSLTIFLMGLCHAMTQKRPRSRRIHLVLLVSAFLGGIGGDVIFSYLPLVDNFYHAQASVMITPRLPLHIPLFYCGWYVSKRGEGRGEREGGGGGGPKEGNQRPLLKF